MNPASRAVGRAYAEVELEPWLDRKALAEYLGCSVRSIEMRMAEGMPAWKVMGRVKFRVSEVEPWLMEQGHMERLDGGCSVVAGSAYGAATATTAPPHDREVSPDG
jgi:hypothetical protein